VTDGSLAHYLPVRTSGDSVRNARRTLLTRTGWVVNYRFDQLPPMLTNEGATLGAWRTGGAVDAESKRLVLGRQALTAMQRGSPGRGDEIVLYPVMPSSSKVSWAKP
jgi:hypothetical protein